MRLVQGDEVAEVPAVQHRAGGLTARILLEGSPGSLGNFQLSLAVTGEEFVSPRHRHNFEQYRCVLEGESDFGRDGIMAAGAAGYFPEGVYYGPQSNRNNTLTAVLQFGGRSRSGYLSAAEVTAGMTELAKVGDFQKGVFRRHEGASGRRNQDAFEAIWEHVNKRPLVYPASAYSAPCLMHPDRQNWAPVDGAPGLSQKRLGEFAANDTVARLLKLESSAEFHAEGPGIYLILSGTAKVGSEAGRRLTSLHVGHDEIAVVVAETTVTVLHFKLPRLGVEADHPVSCA